MEKEINKRINEALKTPYNRKQIINIIKDYSSDEFETKIDLWQLAEKTNLELIANLHSIKEYYSK